MPISQKFIQFVSFRIVFNQSFLPQKLYLAKNQSRRSNVLSSFDQRRSDSPEKTIETLLILSYFYPCMLSGQLHCLWLPLTTWLLFHGWPNLDNTREELLGKGGVKASSDVEGKHQCQSLIYKFAVSLSKIVRIKQFYMTWNSIWIL